MKTVVLKVLLWLENGCLWMSKIFWRLQLFFKTLWAPPKEPQPVIVYIPPDVQDEYQVYISKCYANRVRSFKVSEKMRKYQVGQVVDGYKGQTNKPKRGALLGSFHQSGGGGYFLMRLDNQRIIQVFTVRPVLE